MQSLYNVLKNIVNSSIIQMTTSDIDAIVPNSMVTAKPVGDYIVEQGTSGIWTYRKWNSGVAECWGRGSFTVSGSGTVWNSTVYYYGLTTIDYPFTFYSVPTEFASPTGATAYSYWLYKGDNTSADNTTSHTARYGAIKVNTFSNGTVLTVSFLVQGRWKQ